MKSLTLYEDMLLRSITDRLFNIVRIAERHEVTKNNGYLRIRQKKKCIRMLDLGCGDGTSLFHLYKNVSRIIGIDLNKAKLRRANFYGKMLGLDCSVVLADATYLPFKDSTFDLVFSNCVLEHIPNDLQCFEDTNRILKVGGEFIATVPNLNETVPAPFVKLLFEKLRFFRSTELSQFESFEQALPVVLESRWNQARRGYSMLTLKTDLENKNFQRVDFSFFQTGVCRLLHNLAVCSRLDDVFPINFVLIGPLLHIFKFFNNGLESSCAELAFKAEKV